MVCILNFLQGLITFENVTSAECSMKGGGGGVGGEVEKAGVIVMIMEIGKKTNNNNQHITGILGWREM